MIIPTDPVSGPKALSDPHGSPSAPCKEDAPSDAVGDEAGENVGLFSLLLQWVAHRIVLGR